MGRIIAKDKNSKLFKNCWFKPLRIFKRVNIVITNNASAEIWLKSTVDEINIPIINMSRFLLYRRNTTLRKQVDVVGSDEVGLAKREQEDTPTVRSWVESFLEPKKEKTRLTVNIKKNPVIASPEYWIAVVK